MNQPTNDFKLTKEVQKQEKGNAFSTNTLFSIMLGMTFMGSVNLFYRAFEYTDSFKKKIPENFKDYEFPSVFDFKITLAFVPILIVK